ncbi:MULTISPECIES: hypothetical protein [Amycolatopsis]|uniref:hypothetical protein n=1 Tax=Amycolatopsis TaxID=1813 RepID=UPI00136DB0EB|nr:MULTISPECIES: hypothetical protein [Amycolatopsis]
MENAALPGVLGDQVLRPVEHLRAGAGLSGVRRGDEATPAGEMGEQEFVLADGGTGAIAPDQRQRLSRAGPAG